MSLKFLLFLLITICVSSVFTTFLFRSYPKHFRKALKKKLKYCEEELKRVDQDKVRVQVYYESHCPHSRKFYEYELTPALRRLGDKLEILTYPFGNARIKYTENDNYNIQCQHGSAECYGNRLHACAIENMSNLKDAIFFNCCLMDDDRERKGSDDRAFKRCERDFNIDGEPIRSCANGPRGKELHAFYGETSKKVSYNAVPYVLINGKTYDGDNFMVDVCASFQRMPQECKNAF